MQDKTVMIQIRLEDEYCLGNKNTKIYIAAFTISIARLTLYSYMQQMDRQLMYTDTDSCTYVEKAGLPNIPTGDHLGDMSSELGRDNFIASAVA